MLNEAEKTYILHGVEENFRVDGRECGQYRPMELEADVIAHAFGSARLRLANTDVLVAVKIEVDVPLPEHPTEGKIEFFVDCSANATPDFEGRGGEELALQISTSLAYAYKSAEAFDLSRLCILKGRKCWKLLVDILLLECGGNLYDAVSLAVKAALHNTLIPKIRNINLDGTKIEMDVSDNVSDCQRLNVVAAPVMVTVCKIGEHYVVDPSAAEEQCSMAAVVVAFCQGHFANSFENGPGSLHPETLIECLEFGSAVASCMDSSLLDILSQQPSKKDIGFLL